MSTRAAVYARVSTDEQAQNFSIPHQLEQLRAYCTMRNYTIVSEYIDAGYSGTSPERPEYNRLLNDCRGGRVDIVLVYRIDRFFRSNRHMYNALGELEEWNVGFASVTESFDTSSAMGKAMLGMLSTFAEWERNTFIERSHHGMRKAVREGQYSGGIVAYGYRFDPETKRLDIDEDEAPIVRRIFHLCVDERLSTAAIAERLNAEGVPTKYGREGRGVRGKATANKWRAGRINNMLKNRAYCGEWTYGRRSKKRRPELTRGQCPAIVRPATVDAAAAQLRRNNTWASRNARRSYLLRGLVICGTCNHHYSGTYYTRASGEEVQYYRCNRDAARRAYLGESCGAPTLPAKFVEDLVWADISGFLERPEIVRALLADRAGTATHDDHAERLGRIEARLRQLRDDEAKLLALYTDSHFPMSRETLDKRAIEIDRYRRECEQERAELRDAQRAVQVWQEQLDRVEILLLTLRGGLETATESEKRQIIEVLLRNVVVSRDEDGRTRVRVTYAFDDKEDGPPELRPTRAGVHGANHHHVGGEGERAAGAADRHDLVLQRLAQHLQRPLVELGQLIEEEDAAVRQADLAGARPAPAADQPGVADGVVRRAEGAAAHQRRPGGQQAADRVDLRHLQRLRERQARQDRRQRAGQQRLARPRRSGHDRVVPAGRGDLQPALDLLLPPHVRQVDAGRRLVALVQLQRPGVGGVGGDRRRAVKVGEQIAERGDRQHLHARHQRGLARVVLGDEGAADAAGSRQAYHRQHAVDVAHRAVKPQLPHQDRVAQDAVGGHLPRGDEDAERDRQVVGRPLLAHVRRRQIDRDVPVREARPGVADRRAHPLPRLLDRRVRQPDDEEPRLPHPDVDLHLDQQPVEPNRRATEHRGQHVRLLDTTPDTAA